MRAHSSLTSRVVVVLILATGCTPAEDPPLVATPPAPPSPSPGPSQDALDELLHEVEPVRNNQIQGELHEIRERTQSGQLREGSVESAADIPSPRVSRLFFQCTDDITFAVRSIGRRLEVFPPGRPNDYLVLTQQASDSDLYAASRDAAFRMNGDLATLEVGRDRYVDCVSNPAAAVWQEPPRAR